MRGNARGGGDRRAWEKSGAPEEGAGDAAPSTIVGVGIRQGREGGGGGAGRGVLGILGAEEEASSGAARAAVVARGGDKQTPEW